MYITAINTPYTYSNKIIFILQKLLDGMPVFIEVSPDGIQVLASDEKVQGCFWILLNWIVISFGPFVL